MNNNIPLVDLRRQRQSIKSKISKAIQSVIGDAAFISNKYVKIFEECFARYCGVKYCIGVSSGTNALLAAYAAIGITKGNEVITVANTFTATSEPLRFLGAKPVFVDINPATYLINPSEIIKKINKKTKAIVPVHLYGQAASMEEIMKIARKFNLKVIEECAHAQGAERNGKKVGTFGDIGAYSFNPSKVLGAYGHAGCVITNNKKYADFIRQFINHGRKISNKYLHDFPGLNLRMDGIQAAILTVKLDYLDEWVKKRNLIASRYNKSLSTIVKTPSVLAGNKHAYHLYVIAAPKRNKLLNYLHSKGIEAGIHYPVPLHFQKAYNSKKEFLPVTENLSKQILSLPIFPEITDKEIQKVSSEIKRFLKNK